MSFIDDLIEKKGFGVAVILLSAAASILFWFGLTWLIKKKNVSATTAFLLFIAGGFSIVSIIAGAILASQQSVRQSFSADMQKIDWKDWILIAALPVVFISIAYLTYKVFESENTLVGRFVPVRFALSVVAIAIIGILVFKNKLSVVGWVGIGTLFVGSVLLMLSKFI